ncbi:hypothetical protein AX17_005728 [Amanita inopinata Kibby_2008]|nr:hypothetical protein AX17_005728 [Amanita inopinata Kibby_2008]
MNNQSNIDEAIVRKLEKQLGERPEKHKLIERNILKDDKGIAPSLIAAREKLERSRLEVVYHLHPVYYRTIPDHKRSQDKLDQALQQRPKAEELVEQGILNANESPSAPA